MNKRNKMWLPKRQPLVMKAVTAVFKPFGKGINKCLFSFFSGIPGKVGIVLRSSVARNITQIGKFVLFDKGVIIKGWEHLKIGNYCTFNEYCYINAEGGLKIGNYVMLAYFTKIITDSHLYGKEKPIIKQEIIRKPIIIEDDVWIGTGAVITAGKIVTKGSIIGANAVVTKDTEKDGIYGGVPAKLIKYRE
jgi:acetyltransferase-like isoleucine patch superfamily enzyme